MTRRMILILLAAAVVAVAGCSGGGGGADANKLIKEAFSSDIDSGKVAMNVSANLRGLPEASGPVSIKVNGPFDGLKEKIKDTNRLPRVSFTLALGASGQNFSGGFISTGDKAFVGVQGTSYVLSRDDFTRLKNQLESAQARGDKSGQPDLSTLGVHPQDWLKNPKDKGTEDVAGTKTDHIAADVDVSKMLDDVDGLLKRLKTSTQAGLTAKQRAQLPGRIPPDTKKQIVSSVKEATFDVFSGKDDKTLRKLQVHLSFDIPQSLRARLQGLQGGDIDFTLQLSEVNQPQTVTAPKNARPFSELQQQLGSGALGNLGAGSSGGGSSSGSGSSSGTSSGGGTTSNALSGVDPKFARRYLKCVESAKSRAALRGCANILK
jgi:hypothetical protein